MIRRLKAFFRTIWLSLADMGHYRNALTLRGSAAVKYLYGLLVIMGIVGGIVVAAAMVMFVPTAERTIDDFKRTLPGLYPPDLVVTLSGGMLSTNREGPVAIPFPAHWKAFMEEKDAEDGERGDVPDNIVVIDTDASVEDYALSDAVVLVTERAVVYPKEVNARRGAGSEETEYTTEIAFQTFENADDQVINRKTWDDAMAAALPVADMVPAIIYSLAGAFVVLLPLLGALFALLWNLFYLVFASLVLWLIAKVMGRTLKYGEVYKLALYGMTVPLLYSMLQTVIGFNIPGIPDFTVVLCVWMAFVFSRLPKIASMPLRSGTTQA